MDPIVVGTVVFACTFGGALLGMWVRTVLPARHFDADSKDTVKLGIGLVATLVLVVVAVLGVCALSVAAALFLVLEMDDPFSDILKVSPEPLRYANAHLNQ
jgi:hypothetical protein